MARGSWGLLSVWAGWLRRPPADRAGWLAESLPPVLQDWGPGATKIGQFLSVRHDLLPESVTDALAGLQHDLPAEGPDQALGTWLADEVADLVTRAGLVATPARVLDGGTIASVYELSGGGATYALKIVRRGVRRQLELDVARLRRCARLVGLLHRHQRLPYGEILTALADTLSVQTDLVTEAELLHRMATSLAAAGIDVVVPRTVPELSHRSCLVMDKLELRPAGALGDAAVSSAATRALQAVFHLMFVEGIVHCDLHPGNLLLDPAGRPVLLDAGFVHRLAPSDRVMLSEFFLALANGSAGEAWLSVTGTMAGFADPATEGFRRVIADYSSRSSSEFNVRSFGVDLLTQLRRLRIPVPPGLLFPLLSLMSMEGTLQGWGARDIDFQIQVAPYAMECVLRDGADGLTLSAA